MIAEVTEKAEIVVGVDYCRSKKWTAMLKEAEETKEMCSCSNIYTFFEVDHVQSVVTVTVYFVLFHSRLFQTNASFLVLSFAVPFSILFSSALILTYVLFPDELLPYKQGREVVVRIKLYCNLIFHETSPQAKSVQNCSKDKNEQCSPHPSLFLLFFLIYNGWSATRR